MTTGGPLRVALDLPLRTGDIAFTFAAAAASGVLPGTGVVVPFGRRLMHGIVLGEGEMRPDLRPVLAVVDSTPEMPQSVLALAEWTARTYVSSVGEALAVATPWEALGHGLVLEAAGATSGHLSGAACAVLARLARQPLSLTRAARLFARLPDVVDELAAAGVVAASTAAVRTATAGPGSNAGVPSALPAFRRPDPSAPRSRVETAITEALEGGTETVLLAGWNRVPAYLHAMALARARGWSCVAACVSVDAAESLAAEAAQAGLRPVLLHGSLRPPARASAWRAITGAHGAVVIGTRAAVFAPVADPALLIVDDEDNSGHKEERAPRYVTAAVAAQRAERGGLLMIGATTPSVATYAGVNAGRVRLVPVPSPRPRIGVIDLRRRADPDAPLGRVAEASARRVARAGGRVVVLVDRRGYAGGLHCGECGSVERCPQCGVAMPYDRAHRQLRCRVCGRVLPAPRICSRCGAPRLRLLGAGTERLVAVLRRHIARVWRFDAESAADSRRAQEILGAFRERGGALVATTMVVPHLARLHPDLVVVASADRWLHRPEFRAAERALGLLREVGIATRAQVLVETADPHHAVIAAAQGATLRPFYAAELTLRRDLGYPPYRVLASVTVTARTVEAADALVARLAQVPDLDALGSTPRLRSGDRRVMRQAVVKAADRETLGTALWMLAAEVGRVPGARLAVDVDPIDL
jgi:primosomal protein N' (replication factor Y)